MEFWGRCTELGLRWRLDEARDLRVVLGGQGPAWVLGSQERIDRLYASVGGLLAIENQLSDL